jgi:hydrogenase maturation protease
MSKSDVIVLGLGNEYISDDGIGIHTIREIQNSNRFENCTIKELAVGGIELLDSLTGYDRAIIVDAFVSGADQPGTIYRYRQTLDEEIPKFKSSHQINLSQVVGLAKMLGIPMPKEIIVFGVEAADITTFNKNCTPKVEAVIPELVELIQSELCGSKEIINRKNIERIN